MSETNTTVLQLTDAAVKKVKSFLATRDEARDKLFRVSVRAGGCSGYEYVFGFDQRKEDDVVNSFGDVEVLVDPRSVALVKGCILDYEDTLMKSGFSITNPNAKSSCGCGSSFGV